MSEQWFEPIYFDWAWLEDIIRKQDVDGVYSISGPDLVSYLVNREYRKSNKGIAEIAEAIGTGTRFVEDILAGQPRHEYYHVMGLLEYFEIQFDYLELPDYTIAKESSDWRSPLVPIGWAGKLEPLESNKPRSENQEIVKPEGILCLGTSF